MLVASQGLREDGSRSTPTRTRLPAVTSSSTSRPITLSSMIEHVAMESPPEIDEFASPVDRRRGDQGVISCDR